MRVILLGLVFGSVLGLVAGTAASRHVVLAVTSYGASHQQVVAPDQRVLEI